MPIVLATHNRGKRDELRRLLEAKGVPSSELVMPESLGLTEPEEVGESFEAIARLKAQIAADASGLPAIADDTGLCVDALGGGPGLHSKPWAEARGGWEAARLALADQLGLRGDPHARARANFACAVAWAEPHGPVYSVQARVHGELAWPERGDGPGFVKIFRPDIPPFWREGVFGHRRAAFEAMWKRRDAQLSE